MRRARPIFLALALAALAPFVLPATAQDFQKGLDAANRRDYETALREWRPLAEAGDAVAQGSLASLYALGLGVETDVVEALKWYRLAAGQGHANAQFNLGQLLRSKQAGDYRDAAEAMKWYRLAADQGVAEAHYKLGLMNANGEGGAQDFIRAHMRWSIAEALGFEEATRQLDSLSKLMTTPQVAEAQQRANAWMTRYELGTAEAIELRHTLLGRKTEIARLQEELAAREAEIVILRRTLAEIDSTLADMRTRVTRRRAERAALATEDTPPHGVAPGTTAHGDTQPDGAPADRTPARGLPAGEGATDDVQPGIAFAPTVNGGAAAYRAGDYARAFAIWQPLAEAGNARAQFHIGALYFEGRGVESDPAKAWHWLALAAANGIAPAAALLESVGAAFSPRQSTDTAPPGGE